MRSRMPGTQDRDNRSARPTGRRRPVGRKDSLHSVAPRPASPASTEPCSRLQRYARKKIAEHLGDMARTRNAEIDERRGRLERTEARIAGLVKFISEGDHSAYIRSTSSTSKSDKQIIDAILREVAQPIRLPSPGELERMVYELESRNHQDVLAAREAPAGNPQERPHLPQAATRQGLPGANRGASAGPADRERPTQPRGIPRGCVVQTL
jgi:hypothetical protein